MAMPGKEAQARAALKLQQLEEEGVPEVHVVTEPYSERVPEPTPGVWTWVVVFIVLLGLGAVKCWASDQ